MSFTRGNRSHNGFPKPGDELKDVPSRHSRDGWTHIKDHDSVYIDGKQYRHMREWSRPCAICSGPIEAFEKVGTVDASSRFGNRNCKDHRGLLPAFEKGFIVWDKEANAIAAGPMCGGRAASAEDAEELKGLRDAVDVWGAVWKACHPLLAHYGLVGMDTFANAMQKLSAENNARLVEIQVLKAKLAPYELQPAMQAHASQNKFPWDA